MDELVITATFGEPRADVRAATVGVDGRSYYTLERREGLTVAAHDAATFEERWRRRLTRDTVAGPATDLAVSPDEAWIALLVWDAGDGEGPAAHLVVVVAREQEETWAVRLDGQRSYRSLRWTPDGSLLVASEGRADFCVIDAARRALVDAWTSRRPLGVSRDGSRVAELLDEWGALVVVLRDREGRREVDCWHLDAHNVFSVIGVAVDPAGRAVWCSCSALSGDLLLRCARGQPSRGVALPGWAHALFEDERGLTALLQGGAVARAEQSAGGAIELSVREGAVDAALDRDLGISLAHHDGHVVTLFHDSEFALYDLQPWRPRLPRIETEGAPQCLLGSPDGRRVAVSWRSGAVRILDAETLEVTSGFELDDLLPGFAWAPDGRWLYAFEARRCVALRPDDGSLHEVARLRDEPWFEGAFEAMGPCVALAPDGRLAVATGGTSAADGSPEALWWVDLGTGSIERRAHGERDEPRSLRFAAGGAILHALATPDGAVPRVLVLDGRTGVRRAERRLDDRPLDPRLTGARLSNAALSPGGAFVVAEHEVAPARLLTCWRVETGDAWTVRCPPGRVLACDDTRIAYTSEEDGRMHLRVFEVDTLDVVGRFDCGDERFASQACFVGDGLVAAFDDGRVVRLAPA